jgi:hypothetical protein
LALYLLGLIATIGSIHKMDATVKVWCLSLAIFVVMCLTSKLNLGIRYLSVAYPLAVMTSVDALARRQRIATLILLPLLICQGFSAAQAWPADHLSYFNSFAGGPASGDRYLADSNLDWGQDLPRLAEMQKLRGETPIILAYFGENVDPASYGVVATPWDAPTLDPDATAVAISVSLLRGIEVGPEAFSAFRNLAPDANAGYSIRIYSLKRSDVREALASSRRSIGRSP